VLKLHETLAHVEGLVDILELHSTPKVRKQVALATHPSRDLVDPAQQKQQTQANQGEGVGGFPSRSDSVCVCLFLAGNRKQPLFHHPQFAAIQPRSRPAEFKASEQDRRRALLLKVWICVFGWRLRLLFSFATTLTVGRLIRSVVLSCSVWKSSSRWGEQSTEAGAVVGSADAVDDTSSASVSVAPSTPTSWRSGTGTMSLDGEQGLVDDVCCASLFMPGLFSVCYQLFVFHAHCAWAEMNTVRRSTSISDSVEVNRLCLVIVRFPLHRPFGFASLLLG
jgi:hypothetical protein